MIYLLELTTVVEGWLLGVNPLDQPGVEAYKNFMFGLLERPDAPQFARYRAALTAAGPRPARVLVVILLVLTPRPLST